MADLRRELEARTLSSKGLKSQLIARLTKSLKSEQEKEEQEAENKDEQVCLLVQPFNLNDCEPFQLTCYSVQFYHCEGFSMAGHRLQALGFKSWSI